MQHVRLVDDGRIHVTFTQTGTFVAVPLEDPSLPTFTGHLHPWGGFNDNGEAHTGAFIFNIGGAGSDGSTFHQHELEHFNATQRVRSSSSPAARPDRTSRPRRLVGLGGGLRLPIVRPARMGL